MSKKFKAEDFEKSEIINQIYSPSLMKGRGAEKLIGQLDKSGKHVKTASGWVSVKGNEHLVSKHEVKHDVNTHQKFSKEFYEANKKLWKTHDSQDSVIRTPVEGAYDIGTSEYEQAVQSLIDKENKRKKNRNTRNKQLVFPNYETAHLWMEFDGQISDGKYENTNMFEQNKRMYDAEIKVDKSLQSAKMINERWQGRVPSFKDLIWLFSAGDSSYDYYMKDAAEGSKNGHTAEEAKSDVRAVFSKVPTAKIKTYIDQLQTLFTNSEFKEVTPIVTVPVVTQPEVKKEIPSEIQEKINAYTGGTIPVDVLVHLKTKYENATPVETFTSIMGSQVKVYGKEGTNYAINIGGAKGVVLASFDDLKEIRPATVEEVKEEIPVTAETKIEKPIAKVVGENGNVFNTLGIVGRALRKAGQGDKIKEMNQKVFKASSYEEALHIMGQYADLQ
jgi:hypothetical protein